MKRIAVVTGAANGIGRAVATTFATSGFCVVIADIDNDNGQQLQDRLSDRGFDALFVRCDVADPESITGLVKAAVDQYGRIDVVINNAGISEFTPPDRLAVADWDRVLNTNLRGSFLLTREAAPIMKANGGGAVVNIASTRALMSEKHSEAYAASKGGLLALTHAMALS